MPTDVRALTMYLSDTWKVIFSGLDQAISHAGTNFTLVSYGEKDFIRDSMGTDGKIDSTKLCMNIGNVIECEPLMKDKLIRAFEKERITFAAVETVEQGGGAVSAKCYFAVDSRDKERTEVIINELNRLPEAQRMKPMELMAYCEANKLMVSGISRIEPELYETLQQEDKITFPYSAVKNRDGSYDVRIPALYEESLRKGIIDAAILCSAYTREAMMERSRERSEAITDALSKITDNKKAYLIVDPNYPEHLIRTSVEGFHSLIHTAEGDKEVDFVERTDPAYQSKAYNILTGYSGYTTILAMDKNARQQLETLREAAKQEKEPELLIKVEYYKRSLHDHIREAVEGDYIGRLKDNEVKFHDAIDHTVVLGAPADTLKGDLQGDLQLNERAMAGFVKESSIDLSDLNGDPFVDGFCDEVLLTKAISDAEEKEAVKSVMKNNARLYELAEEPAEVKAIVIREIQRTMEEVRMVDYEFVRLDRDEMRLEVAVRENEANEIHIDLEDKEL